MRHFQHSWIDLLLVVIALALVVPLLAKAAEVLMGFEWGQAF